mgnify:CR=1 FL=1
MALPAIAATFVGGIIAGITQFFATRAGTILLGLGVSFIFVKGIEKVSWYVINDMKMIISMLGAGSGGGGGGKPNYYEIMFQFAAYAGLFDAINILIGGVFTYVSILQFKAILGRMK